MTLILELAESQQAVLNEKAQAQGVSAEEYALLILNRDLDTNSEQSVSAIFQEIWSDMPDDVRSRRPLDGAEQIDHYVYGVPKHTR